MYCMSQQVCVRFSEKEIEALDKLAKYLEKRGMIQENSRSAVIRYAVELLHTLILKDIERRRRMEYAR